MSSENPHLKTQVIIAVLSLIGTLGAALITAWSVIQSSDSSNNQPAPQQQQASLDGNHPTTPPPTHNTPPPSHQSPNPAPDPPPQAQPPQQTHRLPPHQESPAPDDDWATPDPPSQNTTSLLRQGTDQRLTNALLGGWVFKGWTGQGSRLTLEAQFLPGGQYVAATQVLNLNGPIQWSSRGSWWIQNGVLFSRTEMSSNLMMDPVGDVSSAKIISFNAQQLVIYSFDEEQQYTAIRK